MVFRCVHCLVGLPRRSCFEPIARTIKQASGGPLSAAVQGSGKRRSHIADHLNCGPRDAAKYLLLVIVTGTANVA
jgi:hypothetical protein